jgi:hypothetical protein
MMDLGDRMTERGLRANDRHAPGTAGPDTHRQRATPAPAHHRPHVALQRRTPTPIPRTTRTSASRDPATGTINLPTAGYAADRSSTGPPVPKHRMSDQANHERAGQPKDQVFEPHRVLPDFCRTGASPDAAARTFLLGKRSIELISARSSEASVVSHAGHAAHQVAMRVRSEESLEALAERFDPVPSDQWRPGANLGEQRDDTGRRGRRARPRAAARGTTRCPVRQRAQRRAPAR